MANLFESAYVDAVVSRIHKLQPGARPLWGKMTPGQMLRHVRHPLEVSAGQKQIKVNFLMRLMAPMIKSTVIGDRPFSRNSPTMKEYIVQDDVDFAAEREQLVSLLRRFSAAGPDAAAAHPHPLFGKLTAEQISHSHVKHFEHHLSQFGV